VIILDDCVITVLKRMTRWWWWKNVIYAWLSFIPENGRKDLLSCKLLRRDIQKMFEKAVN